MDSTSERARPRHVTPPPTSAKLHAMPAMAPTTNTMRLLAALAMITLAGCASTSPDGAFHDTAKLVETRSGRRVTWNRGGADDAKVAERTRALLQNDLTVDAAVQIALLNNPTLQATYEDLSIAQADLVQAGLLTNPVFGAGVGFPLTGNIRTGVDLSVSEDFLSVFLLAARKRVANAELGATESRVGDAVLRTTYEVEAAFYRLSAAQQTAEMRRTIVEGGAAAIDLATRQHDAGNISDLDLANQAVASEELRTDLMRSEVAVTEAHEELTRLLGLWGDSASFCVAAKLPEMPKTEIELEHLEARAIAHRLDLLAAHQEVDARSQALTLATEGRWLGGSSLGANYEHAPERFSTLGPSAGIELPIFDQKQAMIARVEADLRRALAEEKAKAIDVRSEVRLARARVMAARSVVERYANVVLPLRERVMTLSQQEYDAMLLGAYQLLQAKQNEVNAYRDFIEAAREYWIARAELDRAVGGRVEQTETKNR